MSQRFKFQRSKLFLERYLQKNTDCLIIQFQWALANTRLISIESQPKKIVVVVMVVIGVVVVVVHEVVVVIPVVDARNIL